MTANLRLKPGRPTVDPDHRVCDACSCLPPSGDLPRLIRIPSWPAAERGSPYTEPDVGCPTRSGDAEGNRTGSELSLRPAMPRPIRRWAPMCDRRSPLVWIVSSVRFLPVCTDSVPDASLGSLLGPDRVPPSIIARPKGAEGRPVLRGRAPVRQRVARLHISSLM